jgi:hypothetical protein
MADERTDEQKTADAALTLAIEHGMGAYGWDVGLLTDYVVTVVAQKFTDEGDMHTTYGNLYRDSSMPHYRILGVLRCATIQAERAFNNDDDFS